MTGITPTRSWQPVVRPTVLRRRRLVLVAMACLVFFGLTTGQAPDAASHLDMTPYLTKPSDCQVAPIDPSTLAPPRALPNREFATPIPVEQLPAGEPADPETIADIVALELEFAACWNAGEFLRCAALFNPDLASYILDLATSMYPERIDRPRPLLADDWIEYIAVDQVRVLPDGRVGALVSRGGSNYFRFYTRIGEKWLFDELVDVSGYDFSVSIRVTATPTPVPTPTPVSEPHT